MFTEYNGRIQRPPHTEGPTMISRTSLATLAIIAVMISQAMAADLPSRRWTPLHPELLHWHPIRIHLPAVNQLEPDQAAPSRQSMFVPRRSKVVFAPKPGEARPAMIWSHIQTDETRKQIADALQR